MELKELIKEIADDDSTKSVDDLVTDWRNKHKKNGAQQKKVLHPDFSSNKHIPFAASLSIKKSIEEKIIAHPHFEEWTTDWDRMFVQSVLEQIDAKHTLTTKQVERLKQLSTKLKELSQEDIKKYEL